MDVEKNNKTFAGQQVLVCSMGHLEHTKKKISKIVFFYSLTSMKNAFCINSILLSQK